MSIDNLNFTSHDSLQILDLTLLSMDDLVEDAGMKRAEVLDKCRHVCFEQEADTCALKSAPISTS